MGVIDLDFYCWRERIVDDEDGERLLIPHSDPHLYESLIDFVWNSEEEALDWREEYFEDEEDNEVNEWVLVHYQGTIIPTGRVS